MRRRNAIISFVGAGVRGGGGKKRVKSDPSSPHRSDSGVFTCLFPRARPEKREQRSNYYGFSGSNSTARVDATHTHTETIHSVRLRGCKFLSLSFPFFFTGPAIIPCCTCASIFLPSQFSFSQYSAHKFTSPATETTSLC